MQMYFSLIPKPEKIIGFLGVLTLILSVLYIFDLFRFLPNNSPEYSKTNMKAACFQYLCSQLAINVLIFLLVYGKAYYQKWLFSLRNPFPETIDETILDNLQPAIERPDFSVNKENQRALFWLNVVHILPLATMLLFFFMSDQIAVAITNIVWVLIELMIGVGLLGYFKEEK